jgi:internalin A
METSHNRTWRTRLHFRLRSFLVLVLVLGCGLGWLVRRAQIQRNAVAAIRRAGGYVKYDWEWKDLEPIPVGKPLWPQWLVSCIGVDYFGSVSYVHLNHNPKASDVELTYLRGLTGLEQLYLCDTDVNDLGLVYVSGLTRLRFLNLRRTKLGDVGLGHLKRLTNLRSLLLGHTKVTDDGLCHLEQLTSLQTLDLNSTDITDAGLEHLKGLVNLRQLYLAGTKVTDAGVERLRKAITPKLEIFR